MGVEISRVYDAIGSEQAGRFLIDRLWPRGLSKARAPFEDWLRDIAPSPALRKWYSHELAKYDEFASRYRAELRGGVPADLLEMLRGRAATGVVVLLTATKDLDHSSAAVLQQVLSDKHR